VESSPKKGDLEHGTEKAPAFIAKLAFEVLLVD